MQYIIVTPLCSSPAPSCPHQAFGRGIYSPFPCFPISLELTLHLPLLTLPREREGHLQNHKADELARGTPTFTPTLWEPVRASRPRSQTPICSVELRFSRCWHRSHGKAKQRISLPPSTSPYVLTSVQGGETGKPVRKRSWAP